MSISSWLKTAHGTMSGIVTIMGWPAMTLSLIWLLAVIVVLGGLIIHLAFGFGVLNACMIAALSVMLGVFAAMLWKGR